jgi:K+-transporting ATPase c subunit
LSFATVEPVVVPPPPDGSATQVAAFQIARIGNDKGQTVTMITTAIAVYGGRLQATLVTVSDFVFPLDAQNTLVHSIEARVIGASLL